MRLEPAAREMLVQYSWPGNVRELEHLIGRAALRAQAGVDSRRRLASIAAALLDLGESTEAASQTTPLRPQPDAELPAEQNLRAATDAFQRQLIEHHLQQHQGNRAATARALGIDRANLSRLLKRLGLDASAQAAKRSSR